MKQPVLAALIAATAATVACSPATRMLREPAGDPIQTGIRDSDFHLSIRVPVALYRNGSGSWANDAVWDEYWMTIEARQPVPVEILEVHLIDHFGKPVEPDTSVLELSRRSEVALKAFEVLGMTYAVVGGATVVTAATLASSNSLLAGGAGAVATAGVGAALVGVATYVSARKRREAKTRVEYEMRVRRIRLPTAVSHGDFVKGGEFFPITPCARLLVVGYQVAGVDHELAVDIRSASERQLSEEARAAGGCAALSKVPDP